MEITWTASNQWLTEVQRTFVTAMHYRFVASQLPPWEDGGTAGVREPLRPLPAPPGAEIYADRP